MTLRQTAGYLALFLTPCLVLTSLSRPATAGEYLCCPKTVFYKPRTPRIKFKCVCPKPIGPCDGLENFGYYQTCWQPWPFPPNCPHGPVPPTISTAPPSTSKAAPESLEQLPAPQTEKPEAKLQ